MFEKKLILITALSLTSSFWAAFAEPFIGEVASSWATTNAVTATAGSLNDFSPGNFSPTNAVNGFAFAGAVGVGTKPAYEGATYNSDGLKHSYSPTHTAWLASSHKPSGLANPTGRPVNPYATNNYAQNWISFEFDKPYEITSIDIWNGSYCGAPGGGIDFSLMDVYFDYKVNGVWQMASTTVKLNHPPMVWDWFLPTDNIVVNLKDVTQVVITPVTSWAEDPSWYWEYDPSLQPYWSPKACLSEIRFYIPPPPPALTAVRDGTSVVISWPEASDVILETSDSLGATAAWSEVTGVVGNSYTNTSPTGNQFYRLKR